MAGGNQHADYSASDTLARIVGEQYQNYVNTYQPVENQLIKFATDPNSLSDAANQAKATTDASFTQNGLQRQLSSMGVTPSADQNAALQRRFGLSKSLAEVNNMNHAVTDQYDAVTSALTGPSPNITGLANSVSQTV